MGMVTGTIANPDRERCNDPWHRDATEPERCPDCGGLVKGFHANYLRRCPNDWHVIREQLVNGLGWRGQSPTD